MRADAKPGSSFDIKPPFGLKWGEQAERLEKLLTGAKARIVERVPGQRKVEGLIQSGLKAVFFELERGRLVGVRLAYEQPDWSHEKYVAFFDQTKGRIVQRFKQPARDDTEPKAAQVGRKLREAEWKVEGHAIQLTLLEDKAATTPESITVHYETGDLPK